MRIAARNTTAGCPPTLVTSVGVGSGGSYLRLLAVVAIPARRIAPSTVASRPKTPSRSGGKRGTPPEDELLSRQRALYSLPLGEFTHARNALAKELKAKGQTKEATATQQLKRPVVTAWAVNQLAHRAPEKIEALLAAARTLEAAHRKALSGLGPQALKEANRAFQQTLDALMTEAHRLLSTEGRAITSELFRQAEETLRAAALGTEEDRATLAQGMLTQPLQQAGLGAFSPLTLMGSSPAARPERRVQERPSNRQAAKSAPAPAPARPVSHGGVVLKGPWEPRKVEPRAPPPPAPPPEAPSKRQLREEHAAEQKRSRTEELHQRRREAEQQARETQARLERTTQLQQRRRELKQQAERAERTQRGATLEVARAQAYLKSAEVKTLRMRQAFEQAQAAERERAEAVEQARAQAQAAEQALEQARSELQEVEESLREV